MSDLFGTGRDAGGPDRRSKPAEAKTKVELPPNRTQGEVERGPAFGTPAWDHCKCGGWATLYFPNAGGIRRCQRCARAEGRMPEDR